MDTECQLDVLETKTLLADCATGCGIYKGALTLLEELLVFHDSILTAITPLYRAGIDSNVYISATKLSLNYI